MKSVFRSVLALVLCSVMLIGLAYVGNASVVLGITASAEGDGCTVGSVIEYGTYPQSEVKDEALITELNKAEGDWESYGYYTGDCSTISSLEEGRMVESDYMRYKDVSYNGEKYRAVTFDQYRVFYSGYRSSVDYTYQKNNGYTPKNIYWFKYEPVSWRVLDPETGLVMSNTIIDSQPFNHYILMSGKDSNGNNAYYGDSSKTHYANNYAESSLRKWLNEDFYKTAFSDDEKANILITELDNSSYSDSDSAYDAETTSDKVFILSWDEALNTDYGFTGVAGESDVARRMVGSDYAKSQGLHVFETTTSDADGCSRWVLRSPGYRSDNACIIRYDGQVYYIFGTYSTDAGIVPAMRLQKIKSSAVGSVIHIHSAVTDTAVAPTCNKTGLTEGSHCSVCGKVFVKQTEVPATGHDYAVTYEWSRDCSVCYAEAICSNDGSHKVTEAATVTSEVIVPAACESKGTTEYTAVFTNSIFTSQTKSVEDIPATGHDYEITYEWALDASMCIGTAVCKNDASHAVTEKAVITSAISVAPTCTAKGSTGYTAKFDSAVFSAQTKYIEDIPATGHKDEDNNGMCDYCSIVTDADLANSCRNAKINVAAAKAVDYRTRVTIKANATGIGKGCYLAIYVDGKQVAKAASDGKSATEVTYDAGEIKKDLDYTVKVVDAKGNIQKDANGKDLTKDGGHITVNAGFFKKLIAFFKGLFKKLPEVTVKP